MSHGGNVSETFIAGKPLGGVIRVPGDKSISHRALLLSSLAEGTSRIRGLSRGDDVVRTRMAMEAMGANISDGIGDELIVEGGMSALHEPESVIDVGNSGTGMRLLTGWAAALPWLTVLVGDASLHSRPMNRVVVPLRSMGARIDGRQNGDRAPLIIRGGELKGIDFTSKVASAQLKSALLLAGLSADGPTTVHEPVLTRAHTEEMLTLAGVPISTVLHRDGRASHTVDPSPLTPFELDVPGDPSQAAFWMVGAAVTPGSDVIIENVYSGPGRGGLTEVLRRMGADIELTQRTPTTVDIRVRHSELSGVEVRGDEIASLIDELPVLAVAAALADGLTTIADAEEMRVKESDRIAAVVREMHGLGASITERPDGFVIQGRPDFQFTGGTVQANLDHRIAMTGAIAALAASAPVKVFGWESVATSYPTFVADLARLRSESK